jgi:hypothetical protein
MFKLKIISLIHVNPFNTMLPILARQYISLINGDSINPLFKQDLL